MLYDGTRLEVSSHPRIHIAFITIIMIYYDYLACCDLNVITSSHFVCASRVIFLV